MRSAGASHEALRRPGTPRGGTGNPLLTLPSGTAWAPWGCSPSFPGSRAHPPPASCPLTPRGAGGGGACSLEQGTALGVSTWRWNSSHQRTGGSSLNSGWRMPAPPRVSPRAARLVQRMPPLGSVGRGFRTKAQMGEGGASGAGRAESATQGAPRVPLPHRAPCMAAMWACPMLGDASWGVSCPGPCPDPCTDTPTGTTSVGGRWLRWPYSGSL